MDEIHQVAAFFGLGNHISQLNHKPSPFGFNSFISRFLDPKVCIAKPEKSFLDRIETLGKVEIDQPQVGPKGELSGSERVNRSAAE